MYNRPKDPEAYIKGFERVNEIREYCKENNITDYFTLYERCTEERPQWLRTLQRPAVIRMFQRDFSRAELVAMRKEVIKKEGPNTRRARPVRCVETGEVFKTLSAAAEFVGVKNTRDISDVCHGLTKAIRGYHFEYVTETYHE